MTQFDALCDLLPEEQADQLDALRAVAPGLAHELERLLAADQAEMFLDEAGGAARFVAGLAEQVLGGRFRLVEPLGAGSGGEVWRAEDEHTGDAVAVKLINPALMNDARHVRRFRREFRALARLSHDGCLRMIAEGVVGEGVPLLHPQRRYFVMALMRGGDLSQLVGAPLPTVVRALVQVLAALDHVHRHQLVHRDLKPTNILLTHEVPARPVLADFGIVKVERSGTELTGQGVVMGTVDYLSPEQVRGEEPDPRSDLYAVGCIIHRLLTGSPPFEGTGIARLWARVEAPAPSLRSRCPTAPEALCVLTDQLLERDRQARPQTAFEVATRLTGVLAELDDTDTTASGLRDALATPDGAGAFLFPTGLVGREAFLNEVLERARGCRALGEAGLVTLVAVAGLGKSTTAAAVAGTLAAEGWSVTRAPSADADAVPPLWPFPALLAQLQGLSDGGALPATHGAADVSGRRTEGGLRHARDLGRQLAHAAAQQAAGGACCVLIEDLHEISDGALGVLAQFHDALVEAGAAVFLLTTARPHSQARLSATTAAEQLTLGPLTADEAATLSARLLGVGAHELPPALAALWLEGVGGNPLLLRAMIQNLLEDGSLRRVGTCWELGSDAKPHEAVRGVLDGRLDSLQPDTLEVLTVAAVLGHGFDLDVLREVSEASEERLMDALADGVRAAVLAVPDDLASGERYRFDHAHLHERLLERADAETLTRLHDAIGAALAIRAAPASTLAHHFGHGSDARAALEHLERAALDAQNAHDYSAQATHLERMLQRVGECPDNAWTGREAELRERYADALALSGDHERAITMFSVLESSATSPLEHARMLRKRGSVHLRTKSSGRGVTALEGALVVLEGAPPRTRVGRLVQLTWDALAAVVRRIFPSQRLDARLEERAIVHRELALIYRWIDLYDSAAHLARFNRLAYRLSAAHFRVDANALASMFFALQSLPGAGVFLQERARALAVASGDVEGLARLTIIQGACELMLQDAVTALDRLDEGVLLAQQTGDPLLVSFALSSRAWGQGIVGSIPSARLDFQAAEEHARETGAAWLEMDAMCGRALAAGALGRFDEAQRLAEAVLVSNQRFSFPIFEELAVEALAGVDLLCGRYADATAGYERAHQLIRQHRLMDGWGWLLPMGRMEALCSMADHSGSTAVPHLVRRLQQVEPSMRRMGRLPLYQGCPDVARGVIASRRGKPDAAMRHFARAASAREGNRPSYIDTWVKTRSALEALRLGRDTDRAVCVLDEVDSDYRQRELDGMRAWLTDMRRVLGV